MFPNFLDFLYELIKTEDADISCCQAISYNEGSKTLRYLFNRYYKKIYQDKDELLKDYFLYQGPDVLLVNKLYRKKIFSSLRFKSGVIYEDTEIMPKILTLAEKVAFSTEIRYVYRIREGSTMTSSFSKKNEAIFEVTDNIEKFLLENNYQNVIVPFSFQTLDSFVEIYKKVLFCDIADKRQLLKKIRFRVNKYYERCKDEDYLHPKRKVTVFLIRCPSVFYKSALLVYKKLSRR